MSTNTCVPGVAIWKPKLCTVASVQSFALWQQATIEITRRDHSIIARSRHMYMVLFFTHIPFMANHTFNATPLERLQQHPLLFTTNRTNCTFFLWRFHMARPSHPGHGTILLWLESPSGTCAKLRTVAASNNKRSHATITLLLLVRTAYIWCYSSWTSRSWWITHLTQCHWRGCNTGNAMQSSIVIVVSST